MSNKINLEFSGTYTLGESFNKMNDDLKKAGKSTKDAGDAIKSSVNSIAGAFDGKMNASITTSLSLFSEMAKGGIWGAMSVAVGATVNFIVEKWNEAKEAARKYAEICNNEVVAAIGRASESFKGVSDEIAKAKADMDDLNSVMSGGVAQDAKQKIHELHLQTLQQVANETSESGKRLILAQEALEAASINYGAKIEVASSGVEAAAAKVGLADEKVAAAKDMLREAESAQAAIVMNNSAFFARRNELQNEIASVEEKYRQGVITHREADSRLKEKKIELANLEEENAAVVKLYTQTMDGVKSAKETVAAAESESASASLRAVAAKDAYNDALRLAKEKNLELSIKLDEAKAAHDEETREALANVGREKEAAEAKSRDSAIQRELENLKLKAVELGVESNEAIELYHKAIEDGYEVASAYLIAQGALNRALEERTEAEASANSGGDNVGSRRDDLVEKIAEGTSKGVGGTTVNTSVDASGVGQGVDSSSQAITLGNLQREMRDEERESRDHLNAVKGSQSAIQAFIQGRMSPDMANKMMDKMKASGFTVDDFESMTKRYWDSKMLDLSQQRQFKESVENIENKLKEMGLK